MSYQFICVKVTIHQLLKKLQFFITSNSILHNRWQYFYKSQVLRGFSPGASDQTLPADEDRPEHSEQLLAILTAYGQALERTIDPHITRTVLMSLHSLHERWKLFHREFFKTNLLSSFLWTILNLLLSSNGVLHHDQLINVLFHMSQANVDELYNSLIRLGYMPHTKNIDEIYLAKVRWN